MATRRFYWLKLNEGFFNRNEVRYLERMDMGHAYLLLYIKLMLQGINAEGELYFKDNKPFTCDTIAMIMDTDVEVVKKAMETYLDLGMMELTEDGVYKLCDFEDLVGTETSDARRMRRMRERSREEQYEQKANTNEHCSKVNEHCYTDIDIDKDIDIEKEKDKEIDIDKEREGDIEGAQGRTHSLSNETELRPCLNEVIEYSRSRGNIADAEKFYDHYSAVGWRLGRQPIEDWKAAFRKWEKNEHSKPSKPTEISSPQEEGSFDTDDFFQAALRRSYEGFHTS